MTPKQLDYIANGAKVFIYKRPHDGRVYASVHDYERFGVKPLETVRVPLTETSSVASVEGDPKVLKAIRRHSA